MDEHHSWYNGSVWHIHWPYQVYVGQWSIFYGSAILLHILKTIWWRNVVLGIMDHCDSKDRPCKIYVGQWPIFHGPLILPYIIVRLKLFLYIKKWHRPGVFVPLRALALVFLFFFSPIFKYENFSSHFSQELWGLKGWNVLHMWKMGGCTRIRLLLYIGPFISSFFFLSNFLTLKFFVNFFSGTVRPRRLKLGTHVGRCIVYTGIRLLLLFHPFIFHFSFSPILKH